MPKKRTTVLVTGGSGFAGSHLVDALVKKGYRVVVIDKRMRWLNPKAKYYKMRVESPKVGEVLKKEKPLYIFHLAAQVSVPASVKDPLEDAKTNIIGILNLIESCRLMDEYCKQKGYCTGRWLKKIIFFSTGGAIYGSKAKPPTSETFEPKPESPYAINKLCSEKYLDFYHKIYGLPYVALRFANLYGPRQDSKGEAGVIAIFTHKLLAGKTAVIDGNGRQTRDFLYIDDVVSAALAAMKKPFVGVVNIGTGKEISINHLFKLIKKYIGSKQPEVHAQARKGDVKRSALKITRAKRELNWSPKVDIDKGLKKTVGWFRKRK